MIPKSKFGDCSNQECVAVNTECVKVGKELFCLNCRNKQKIKKQLSKADARAISRKVYKDYKQASEEDLERVYLIQDLDAIVSKYIRMKEANLDGIVKCYTCFRSGSWKSFDCGHFIPRSNMALRWDVRNLRPQCKKCNQYDYGNIEEFELALEGEQPGIVKILTEESRNPYKWSRDELKELLIDFRAKFKIVETKLKKPL
jgi:hypothetical protein